MNPIEFIFACLSLGTITGIIGAWIGSARGGLAMAGFILGGFLGPIGWLVTAVLPSRRPAPRLASAIHFPTTDPIEEFEMRQRVANGPPPPPHRANSGH